MKKKYPRVEAMVFNFSVLFLVAEPTSRTGKIPYGFCTTGAVVVPRRSLDDFRELFLTTYTAAKYRYSTLYHFKLLSRFLIFGIDGQPLSTNWDLKMDPFLSKNVSITDLDRKVLMPSSWVTSASHCERLFFRKLALERQLCDDHF